MFLIVYKLNGAAHTAECKSTKITLARASPFSPACLSNHTQVTKGCLNPCPPPPPVRPVVRLIKIDDAGCTRVCVRVLAICVVIIVVVAYSLVYCHRLLSCIALSVFDVVVVQKGQLCKCLIKKPTIQRERLRLLEAFQKPL